MEIVEERDGVNTGVVTKRYFGSGVEDGSEKYFYTRDHLGSIREVIDGNGNLAARYDYDPWGRPTQAAGSYRADFGYGGYWRHGGSGLALTDYRAYDAEVGRWLSRDPIEEWGGLHLYAYVGSNPVRRVDPTGLACGPGGLGDKLVPDLVFEPYCDFHDQCYQYHLLSRRDCDKKLCEGMKCHCRHYPTDVRKGACYVAAWVYCWAVQWFGGRAYDNRKNQENWKPENWPDKYRKPSGGSDTCPAPPSVPEECRKFLDR
ncbi:MAG: hypothetical protein NZ585_10640 [Chloracidobacterium sp.]|nr:hypothetical protein [Chloracidobacterium sp.]MDW8217670.1 RHS repeat-associated core domain-containing protein [Acidobacteriota bacterium]